MKKIYLSLMLSFGALVSFAQLTTGDIAFVGLNTDNNDDFAIVALVDIPANSVIYFTDSELDGLGGFVDLNEGAAEWATGGSIITAGSIVTFSDVNGTSNNNAPTPFVASQGTLTPNLTDFTSDAPTESNFNVSHVGDALFAYLGTDVVTPTTFLAGIQNELGNEGDLTGSGLVNGSTFIEIMNPAGNVNPDGAAYTGPRDTQTSFPSYISLISNFANWTRDDSDGNNVLPFNTTAFALAVAPIVGFDETAGTTTETDATFEVSIPVTLANYNGTPFSLDVTVTDLTSESSDYSLTTSTLSFSANGTQNVLIDINDDFDYSAETLEITLSESTSTGIDITPDTHTLTIADDELAPLVITEIGYNTISTLGSDNDYEFIEVLNTGAETVDLEGYSVSDAVTFSFGTGDEIAAGEYILLVTLASTYVSTGVQIFEFGGVLGNTGETITLRNNGGTTLDEVTYDPDIIVSADGNGPTLSLFDINADNADMTYWIGSATENGTPGVANSDITIWTATSDTDFSNAANWSNGAPSSVLSAVVSAGGSNPEITSDVETASLKIGLGAELDVSSSSLSVSDEFVLDGTADVVSGASLVLLGEASGDGDLSVSRNTTGNAGYSILGSPVDGAQLVDIAADYLYDYDEATSTFMVPSISSMPEGRGFFVGYDNLTPAVTWTGSPVARDVDRNISADGAGFNLVANPYAAAISTTAFLNATATTTHTDGTIYLWDDGGTNEAGGLRGGDYITVNDMGTLATGTVDLAGTGQTGAGPAGNGFITSAQGFFVKAMTGTTDPEVVFTPDMQVTTAGANADANHYRRDVDKQLVRLSIAGNSLYNEILIGFVEGATTGADHGLDASKFSGNDLISFYSLQGNEKYAIQALPSLVSEVATVQLGMDLAEAGQYTLSLNGIEGISDDVKMEIIDQVTGITYNLRETTEISFIAENSLVASKRFSLVLIPAEVLRTELIADQNTVSVFGTQGKVNLLINEDIARANISIYTLGGSQVARFSDVNLSSKKWSADFNRQGLFIMTIESPDLQISKKFVNQ